MDTLHPEYESYSSQKCFIGHSLGAEWSKDVQSACEEVLPKFNLEPCYAAENFAPTKTIRNKIVELIANCRYGVYDISSYQDEEGNWHLPRNVYIEVGIAIALNRPMLLLVHNSNNSVSLPACFEGLEIVKFSGKNTLKEELESRLPQWFDVPPERYWLNRFCIVGNKECSFRDKHPRIGHWGNKQIHFHVTDGLDKNNSNFCQSDRDEIRGAFEEGFSPYIGNLQFTYLDQLILNDGYQFLLCSYCQIVRSTAFAIYRLFPQTPAKVFISIGISIALEKQFDYEIPKVILVKQERDIPSLLKGYEAIKAINSSDIEEKIQDFLPTVIKLVGANNWRPTSLPFIVEDSQDEENNSNRSFNTHEASEDGLDIVNNARFEMGWERLDESWIEAANISRETLENFWERVEIPEDDFIAICQAVGIEDWEEVTRAHTSYYSTLRTKIKYGEILIKSLRDLGITCKTNADVRAYDGQRLRADIVAILEGKADLGWFENSDGTFDLVADLWGVAKKHNQTELINSINQKYNIYKTLAEAEQRNKMTKCPKCGSDNINKSYYDLNQKKQNYVCCSCKTQFS